MTRLPKKYQHHQELPVNSLGKSARRCDNAKALYSLDFWVGRPKLPLRLNLKNLGGSLVLPKTIDLSFSLDDALGLMAER
jgi:hypothetical protein